PGTSSSCSPACSPTPSPRYAPPRPRAGSPCSSIWPRRSRSKACAICCAAAWCACFTRPWPPRLRAAASSRAPRSSSAAARASTCRTSAAASVTARAPRWRSPAAPTGRSCAAPSRPTAAASTRARCPASAVWSRSICPAAATPSRVATESGLQERDGDDDVELRVDLLEVGVVAHVRRIDDAGRRIDVRRRRAQRRRVVEVQREVHLERDVLVDLRRQRGHAVDAERVEAVERLEQLEPLGERRVLRELVLVVPEQAPRVVLHVALGAHRLRHAMLVGVVVADLAAEQLMRRLEEQARVADLRLEAVDEAGGPIARRLERDVGGVLLEEVAVVAPFDAPVGRRHRRVGD